jgi:SSS family solute:Na+ symporter
MAMGIITNEHTKTGRLSSEILMMVLGCFGVYALLFGMGYLIYGQTANALMATLVAVASGLLLRKLWSGIDVD